MSKDKVVSLRVSNVEFSQIKAFKLTAETVSQTARRLLLESIKKEQESLKGWEELIAKLNNADISKVLNRLDTIEESLEKIKTEFSKYKAINFEVLVDYLAKMMIYLTMNYEIAFELLKSQKGELYAQSFQKKLHESLKEEDEEK